MTVVGVCLCVKWMEYQIGGFYMGLKQGSIKHVFGDHCEHVRGEAEKNKAVEVVGPLCRISCQLHRPHIHPLLPLPLVPSVNCTC